jgi:hypothetical protein
MARDKLIDPRLQARAALTDGDTDEARVWAEIYQGDPLHRLAKAVEYASGKRDRINSMRHTGETAVNG